MSRGSAAGVAMSVATILLLLGSSWASAHEKHKQQAPGKAVEVSTSEQSTPSTAHDANPPDHSDHRADSTQGGAEPARDRSESNVPKPLGWLGKFHPPLTNFPIALLTAAAIGELFFLRTEKIDFDHAVRFCVWIGATGAVAAATLGWFFAGFHLVDDEWAMTAHRWTGTATALLAANLLFLLMRASRVGASRIPFRIALFSTAALVAAAGFLGGSLIYGLDHYKWWV